MMPEIIKMGLQEYQKRLGLLLLNETAIQELIKEKTNVEFPIEKIDVLNYLLQSADNSDSFFLELQLSFFTFLKKDIMLLPDINAVLVGSPEEKNLITSENFQEFQNILRIQNKQNVKAQPPKDESPGERKMRLLREKVAKVKKKQANKDNNNTSLSELLEIATVYGVDVYNSSWYAFNVLVTRHSLREKWNQDFQVLCTGADSSKMQIKYWGETLDN